MRLFRFRIWVPLMATVFIFVGTASKWNRDPAREIRFSLKTEGAALTKATAILPKPNARFPVIIYIHGFGESLASDNMPLRQIAELGLAAVGMEYDQTNQVVFDEQLVALQHFVQRQSWAQSNAVAWVGFGLGAQRMLRFVADDPEIQPQLLVQLSGVWDEELAEKLQIRSTPVRLLKRASVLLVHAGNDVNCPLKQATQLAALLQSNGVPVCLRNVPGVGADFGPDRGLIIREAAEYCRSHLPLADYTAALGDCPLGKVEQERFNRAMQRAGKHRGELLQAVLSSDEPERRTLMMVIAGLEDYDLAHAKAAFLKMNVCMAWKARRTYPWCRDLPLVIFEKYVAGPRFFQEPIESWRPALNRLASHEVKYCRTTQEASDRVWSLMNEKMTVNLQEEAGGGIDPLKILAAGNAYCLGDSIINAAVARSVGLAERVTRVLWQNSLGEHFCVEVWSTEDQRWHEIDVTAGDRAFDNDWVKRVPKAAILAPTGDRGLWDGLSVGRWSSFTNTIGLVYPSGEVSIKVMNHGAPAPDQMVGIELPTVKGLVYMALARTDLDGEARLTLGRSAQYPYLFFVLSPEEAEAGAKYPYSFPQHVFGKETWQWVQVQAGGAQEVVMNLEDRRPFDPDLKPPLIQKLTH
jgi:predicted esterase